VIGKDLYPDPSGMSRLVVMSDANRLRPYGAVAGASARGARLLGRNEATTERVRMPSGGQIPSKQGISLHSGGLSQCYRSLQPARYETSGPNSAGNGRQLSRRQFLAYPAGSAVVWPVPLSATRREAAKPPNRARNLYRARLAQSLGSVAKDGGETRGAPNRMCSARKGGRENEKSD
jgi:hypothetical protein